MADYKGKNQNARPKTPTSDYRNQLNGPTQSGSTFPSTFFMTLTGANQVAICINTNVKEEENYGRFDVTVPVHAAYEILQVIRLIIEKPEYAKLSYTIKDYGWIRDGGKSKKTDSPISKARVSTGKDETTGELYIGLIVKNKPQIRFAFQLANFNELVGGDGSVMTTAVSSEVAAKGFVVMYEHLLAGMILKFQKDAEQDKPAGNSGGGSDRGGYNNNNNNGGGNNKPANNDFEDDLPDDF